MRIYKCVKELWVPDIDEDYKDTGEETLVPEGSMWEKQKFPREGFGEVGLDAVECDENIRWIEISEEIFKEHFKCVEVR